MQQGLFGLYLGCSFAPNHKGMRIVGPRPSLRHAQELVRAYCELHGISYCETGIISSYAEVLRHLHAVGGPLRPDLEYRRSTQPLAS